jgi:hypothetical protein
MKIEVTEAQLRRIIELLRKARIGSTDAALIEHLRQYQTPAQVTPINYDEIPF